MKGHVHYESFGSNYSYVDDFRCLAESAHNLSLFMLLVSQFSGIHSSLECIIIIMYMCTRKQVHIILCAHMYVWADI